GSMAGPPSSDPRSDWWPRTWSTCSLSPSPRWSRDPGGALMARAWAEVSLEAIRHNVTELRRLAGGAELCAVVKADGYGHGAAPVARAALEAGATWLGVAQVQEAAPLRDLGIDAPILLLSQPRPDELVDALAFDLDITLYSPELVAPLAQAAR